MQLEQLLGEVHQLRQALHARELIGPAIGILVQRHQWAPDEALGTLRRLSQRYNVKVTRIAQAMISDALARPEAEETDDMAEDDDALTGWMTAQDAELFRVLSKGLDRETRARDAAAIAENERGARERLASADGTDDLPSPLA